MNLTYFYREPTFSIINIIVKIIGRMLRNVVTIWCTGYYTTTGNLRKSSNSSSMQHFDADIPILPARVSHTRQESLQSFCSLTVEVYCNGKREKCVQRSKFHFAGKCGVLYCVFSSKALNDRVSP